MKERQFAEYINRKNTMELRREINRVQRELNAMHRRNRELSTCSSGSMRTMCWVG